jgi:hypothetical protein
LIKKVNVFSEGKEAGVEEDKEEEDGINGTK